MGRWKCSDGQASAEGRWTRGPAPDGKGEFQSLADPEPLGERVDQISGVDPRLHGTPKVPMPADAS